jgi:hypothetical protein
LSQVFDHHACAVLDNLTYVKQWHSDALCRAVTGDGMSKRKLYTDEDDIIMSYKRAIILTGINPPTTAPDLIDRSLLIELERIPKADRRPEEELRRAFAERKPFIFGGLLNTLSATLRRRDESKLERLPRMADFAQHGAAVAEILGFGADAFAAALADNEGKQAQELFEHPIITALSSFVQNNVEWRGAESMRGTAARIRAQRAVAHRPNIFCGS